VNGVRNATGTSPVPDPGPAELERLLRRAVLRFPDALEAEFRRDYFERSVATHRTAFIGGFFILAGFGIVDRWAAPQSFQTLWLLRFAIGCPLVVALIGLSFTPAYRRLMQPAGAFVVATVGILIAIMEIVMKPDEPGYNLYLFGIALAAFFGFSAPRLRLWYAMAAGWVPTLATWWIGFDHAVWDDPNTFARFLVLQAFLIGSCVIGSMVSYLLELSARRTFLQDLLIEQEQARSDALLLNILPRPIAERLKGGEVVVEAFNEASVLFADIVGFTALSASLAPQDLIDFLNDLYSRFDRLAEKHELEKIKTIGDAYMVVGGIPKPQPDHADRIAEMALDMCVEVEPLTDDLHRLIQLRIGLNVGPVVAGVIGRRKFSYDLWGDTVNVASRMQSHGVAGKIQVPAATFELMKGRYAFEGPNTVEIKGKGRMTTYFLLGAASMRQGPRSAGAKDYAAGVPCLYGHP
jgi:class 3 adenylate cyclase